MSVTSEPLREPTSGAADGQRSASGGIVAFSSALWGACLALTLLFYGPQQWGAQTKWPLWFALPVLAAGFAFAEVFVIHLRIRADSHTFSLVELPLAFGLFYVQPLVMVAAQLLAAVLVLVLHRRQGPLKVVFNTAVFIVTSLVAVVVFRALATELAPLQGSTLLQGGAAMLVEAMLSIVLVSTVIRIASGSWRSADLVSNAGFGLATATFTSSLGVVAVVVVDAHPEIAWLLILPVAGTYLASWAYSSQRRRHEGLDFLYQSTKLLHQSADFETAFGELLRRTCDTFNASAAEIVYLPESDAEPICFQLGAGALAHTHELDARHHVLMGLLGERQPLILNASSGGLGIEFLRLSTYSAAIVAPLLGDTRVVGALVIANPLSSVVGFDVTDAQLAVTLANHTAAALENGRLEQSLEQLRVLEGRLSFEATHDPLTGLANRSLFRSNLEHVIEHATGRGGAVLFIDLDDFKTVNDSCGHAAGDALLIEVATRLRNCVSASDTVARLGGDEFAVLLPDVGNPAEASAAAERILNTFEPAALVTSRRMYIRASIGVAMLVPGADPVAMMRDADTAMYVAKAQGKNRVIGFESSMHESSMQRFSLHADLMQAIDNGELVTYYQPIIGLDSGAMLGAEALVRWNHPELGMLAPDSFLRVAELSGLITTIDRIVMDQACAWLSLADATAPGLVPWVNVNVSPDSFRETDLLQRITGTLRRHDLEPRRLGIEITENLIIDQEGDTHEILQQMKQLGVRLALDDFGTGYSSLSYLRTLPVDVIKIAKPFIDDIDQVDPAQSAHAFASAIIALVNALDRFIVAEGIERPEQANILRSLGCHAGQGYHFRRPMTGDVFLGWALQRRDAAELADTAVAFPPSETQPEQHPSPVG